MVNDSKASEQAPEDEVLNDAPDNAEEAEDEDDEDGEEMSSMALEGWNIIGSLTFFTASLLRRSSVTITTSKM